VGLTPELLARMGADEWWEDWGASPDYPAIDTVVSMQTSTLTRLMSPTLFRRVLDNEARVPAGQDAVTAPEVLESIRKEIWSEVASPSNARPTAREPMVSASRRSLQREHVSRLIALSTGRTWGGASGRIIATLASEELRAVQEIVSKAPNGDPYTRAHLSETKERIARALEAAYIRAD
jgi:hypothetical protein